MTIQTAEFDLDLIKRYDGRGPRYTSYPTAVQFHDGFGEDDYKRMALASNGEQPASQPLSIYVHVPFCHSLCYYCGCHKIITRHQHSADPYVEHLVEEMRLQGELFDSRRPVDQLHFGGGTPTFLDERQFARVMDGLARNFGLHQGDNREYSIEIDPRSVDKNTIPRLAEMGFNRLSLGIQDFDPSVQQAVNRIQDEEWTLFLIRQARECGFGSVSVDLIYGLPKQTADSFTHTLESVVQAKPDRIAAYSYAHLPQMFRAQRLIRDEDMPSGAEKLALLTRTVEFLTARGYDYIGMDHFALPEDELVKSLHNGTLHRNFQGYSTHAELDLVGLGVSAIGKVGHSYAQSIKLRHDYYDTVDSGHIPILRGVQLNDDDVLRREVIHALMCGGLAEMRKIEARHGIDFGQYFARELEALVPLQEDGLVEMDADTIRVTPRGRFLLRSIAMPFDAYLAARAAEQRFSKVI
ncbi:oxygen-independent coproporphyrinogen III oxidase [Wenzhouxiangella sp. XN24]|uniref:oxygen-independent coproporphyrinogen III oxidase n=1 Tax=Wenzhouxiangella sp. XN24 TaxID=2713569 RepID=UPI0013E9C3FD|nr:oxygen-independent coproporphyrinogen III oxidase [Wenzhouxiangella sp. XN24]NGX15297.1 oxygen-independent coproporphyrinogen III oxidase [Wenzhouxiangella sp. XN24]